MSVKKNLSLQNSRAVKDKDPASSSSKRRHYNSFFSFKEISMEPGSSLKEMDSNEVKAKIIRWAKAVAAYARQVSGKFGSSRSSVDNCDTGSPRS
ncbi:hypothetical protein KPL70_020121 [Citrus sinensis]|nr:hypothetical protein KPL70_020121 [Citrus sinensis]